MKITQVYFKTDEVSLLDKTWKYSFYGKSVDERGDKSIQYLSNNSDASVSISYNPESFEISIQGQTTLFEALDYNINPTVKSILIDLTTLDLIEIIYILKIAKKNNVNVDCIYCEPDSYKI